MNDNIASKILNDEVGVLPTDTLYGLVGRALSKKVFDRIFRLKERDARSPFIILISSIEDLNLFGVEVDKTIKELLKKYWPGKISIILSCSSEKFSYLHLGTKTLAFRMPNKKDLLELIKKTGPLLAPSANLQGKQPALTINEAEAYFGGNVDFYVDGGKLESQPSTIIKIKNGKIFLVRKGAVQV